MSISWQPSSKGRAGSWAQRLSAGLKDRHPEIPWLRIAGFRNRIAHAYMDIDPDLVWSVIQDELPALVRLAGSELGWS